MDKLLQSYYNFPFSFDKFSSTNRVLGIQMKSTGGVNDNQKKFESSFLKIIRFLDQNVFIPKLTSKANKEKIRDNIKKY